MDTLENQTDKVEQFTLNGQTFDAKVVKVYDGDTIHVVFKYFDRFYKWNCRIAHVDTPELRTKNEDEKKKGYEVRDKLRELILNKIVQIKCGEFDKYGRLLVDVFLAETNTNVNEWLITNNYAKRYEGKTKEKW
jgi:endonuclease YncB( thermonuclease family)